MISARAIALDLADTPGPARVQAAQDACERLGGSIIGPAPHLGIQHHRMALLGHAITGPTIARAVDLWVATAIWEETAQ